MAAQAIEPELRSTGIGVVGGVPWGSHFFLFYQTKEDLFDTLVPFFKAGLENNEFCVLAVSQPLTEEEISRALSQSIPGFRQYLADGSMEIVSGPEVYLTNHQLDREKASKTWNNKLDRALARGYAGMRASGITSWLEQKDWNAFCEYEDGVNGTLKNRPVTILCTYPLTGRTATEILDVARTHNFAITRRDQVWEVVQGSEIKQANAEIRRLNEQLEQRVADRTRELRAVNQKLAHSEDRFRKLVETLPDAIYVLQEDRLVFVNTAGLRLLEAQRAEQLLGKPICDLTHPDYVAAVWRQNRDCDRTGAVSAARELVLLSLDGSHVEVESLAIPTTWDGAPAIEVVARDIREHKRAEQNAQAWQKRLELAQKAGLRIGLWDWNVTAGTLSWSVERCRQFGYPPDTFSGRVDDAMGRVHPEDRLVVEKAIQKVLAGGLEYNAQFRIVRPDGTTCWIDSHGVVVRNGSAHMLGVSIDITEQKKNQESLHEAKMELARVARLATMGELTASIAHEINQPLAAIATNGGASQRWLAMQPPNLEEAREAVSRTVREANRAAAVIERIRGLLKKAPPKPARLDVNEIIREVLALTGNELMNGKVSVQTNLGAAVPPVLGDQVQLQQVVLNLILNAVDAMSAITDRPRTLVIKSATAQLGALIQVQDSGTGLAPWQEARIFEAFFTTKPKGLGMGLSISRSIVEAHGGRLWATPGPAHGTVFQFTLPKAASGHD